VVEALMAYLIALTQPKCGRCAKVAQVELRNAKNELINRYCRPCGQSALVTQKEAEEREHQRALARLEDIRVVKP
jgi:hypothetical protein